MKNRILLILGIIIFSNAITSANLIKDISSENDEEVKVLILEQKKSTYTRVINIGDDLTIIIKDGKATAGYLGKIKEESIIIIDKKGIILSEISLSKIVEIKYDISRYKINSERYSLKIGTRIITEKSKRKKEVRGKVRWTILGIAGIAASFKYFVLKD